MLEAAPLRCMLLPHSEKTKLHWEASAARGGGGGGAGHRLRSWDAGGCRGARLSLELQFPSQGSGGCLFAAERGAGTRGLIPRGREGLAASPWPFPLS